MHIKIISLRSFLSTITLLSLLCMSFTTSAVVTYQSISSELLVNQYPGIGSDIYWQGGSNDFVIANQPDGSPIPGSNTIGSSVFDIGADMFGRGLSFSFQKSEWTFDSNLVIGANQFENVTTQSELFNFQDGLLPRVQSLNPSVSSIVTLNPNNSSSFNLFTQADIFLAESNTIAGYYLNVGQDPNNIFSDASLFSGLDPFFNGTDLVDITQQGVIDQFNFLINDIVDPGWQSLAIYYYSTEFAIGSSAAPNFFSNTSGSFVSYDSGSIPSAQVPEPSTYMLLGLGILSMVGFSRKKIRIEK